MSNAPLVSIFTPVYNEAEYLSECIESVLAQTYNNWEYMIVDNCSTDGSGEIALQYAAMDARISVLRNEQFLRAIPNHNWALSRLSPESKYCKVVLGDDWIFPECLERMVALAERNPRIGLVGAYVLEGTQVKCTGLPYTSDCIDGRDACRRDFLERLFLFGSANSVLYRSDLVRQRIPFFNESNIHADTEVCFDLLENSDFGFVHQVLTFSRVRPGSLSTVSEELNTQFPGILQHLQKYGPVYLTKEEFKRCMDQHMSAYYELLAKSAIRGRDRKFWLFHKSKLAESQMAFRTSRLLFAMVRTVLSHVLNPLDTVQRLLQNRKESKQVVQKHYVKSGDIAVAREHQS
jgi:glycosyltransferase involved in cell wall biosynthesis